MDIINFKGKIRRALQFLFTLVCFGDFKLLFSLIRVGELGNLTSFIETNFLYRCAQDGYGSGSIVEIGSFKGRMTICLALGSQLKRREKVYAIDPLVDDKIRSQFVKNINKAKVDDYIIPLFKKSEEAVRDFDSPIRLLFIDGCHEYEEVKKDILLWKKHLIEGGIIAMHDYLPENYPNFLAGVNKAVNECIINSDEFIVEGCIDSILFASKKRSKNKHLFEHANKINKLRAYLKSKLDKTLLRY